MIGLKKSSSLISSTESLNPILLSNEKKNPRLLRWIKRLAHIVSWPKKVMALHPFCPVSISHKFWPPSFRPLFISSLSHHLILSFLRFPTFPPLYTIYLPFFNFLSFLHFVSFDPKRQVYILNLCKISYQFVRHRHRRTRVDGTNIK